MDKIIISEEISNENITKMPLAFIKDGILSYKDRFKIKNPKTKISYHTLDRINLKYLQQVSVDIARERNDEDIILKRDHYYPWKIINNLGQQIYSDYILLLNGGFLQDIPQEYLRKSIIIGDSQMIKILGTTPTIHEGVCFDTTKGPIILGGDSIIYPFSTLEGPLFIGEGSIIKSAKIGGNVVIGKVCRIGGEIQNSYIGDYTNKAHEGFISESYIGDWCNIGGFTNVASLKIDYSNVEIKVGKNIFDSGMMKMGCVIGNYVRINGGSGITPGSFIDTCSIIIQWPIIRGYIKPFSKIDERIKYPLSDFIDNMTIMMKRRNIAITKDLVSYWTEIFNQSM